MMNACPICGKRFPVIWPEHWIYKRNGVFYCSEQCLSVVIFRETNKLRQIDQERKRERYIVNRITMEQKKKAVQIAIAGGDPRDFLKECGSKNPAIMWTTIRQALKKSDPEMYEKLPARISPKAAEKINTIQPPVVKLTGPIRIETPEANNVEIVETPEAPKQVIKIRGTDTDITKMEKERAFNDRTTTTAIRVDGLGEFYYDKKFTAIDWRTEVGDEVSMGPAWWAQLAEDLPLILKKLGANV